MLQTKQHVYYSRVLKPKPDLYQNDRDYLTLKKLSQVETLVFVGSLSSFATTFVVNIQNVLRQVSLTQSITVSAVLTLYVHNRCYFILN